MIYNVYTKHTDIHGRDWKSFVRIRANGMNHAHNKINDLFKSIDLDLKWS